MNMSTVVTVSLAFIIGAGIGVAKFSGIQIFPAAVGQPDEANAESTPQTPSTQTSVSSKRESENLFDKSEAYRKDNSHDRARALVYGGKLVESGQLDRAEQFYKNRIKAEPADADFHYGLGWTYEQSKRWSQARDAYEQSLSFDPKHLATQNNLAWVLATAPDDSVRDGNRAVKLAEAAMKQAGARASFVADTLAAAYAEAGKFDYAIKFQRWVVDNAPRKKRDEAKSRLELYQESQPFRSN